MAKDLKALTTSTVDAVEEKNASNIAAANSALEKKIKDTIVPDLIQEKVGVSLTNLATKADVQGAQTAVDGKLSEMYLTKEAIQNNYATKAYASEQAMSTSSEILSAGLEGSLSYLWKNLDINNMGNGYFYTKKGNTDGSYALLYNSSNSSGAQFWNYTKDVMSDINVNNGDTNNSYISLVSKYKGETSNSVANTGARININPEGAYYTKGTNESVNDGSEDNEIATKGDLKHISSAQNFTVNGAEVSAMSVSGAVTVNISSDTAIVNVIGGEIDTSTFVSAVTMQGAGSASIDNGLLNISVPASQEIDTSTFVSAVTMQGAGSASISNGLLDISVPYSTFAINQTTVNSATFQGNGIKNISYAEGNALVSIDTAEAQSVTINGYTAPKISIGGGGAQVNYDSSNDIIIVNVPTSLSNPNFNIPAIYLVPNVTKTVEVATDSSGIISTIPQSNINVNQVSANQFNLTATNLGQYQLGFRQEQDAQYYGVAKNALVAVVETEPNIFYVNFSNPNDRYENTGNAGEFVSSGGVLYNGGMTGNFYYVIPNGNFNINDFMVGGKSFTIDWFCALNYRTSPQDLKLTTDDDRTLLGNYAGSRSAGVFTDFITLPSFTYQLHNALTYDGENLRYFNGGTLIATTQVEIARTGLKFTAGYNQESYGATYFNFWNFRIIDGVCAWQSNFTPPTEYY